MILWVSNCFGPWPFGFGRSISWLLHMLIRSCGSNMLIMLSRQDDVTPVM